MKTVLITGCSTGIGAATAASFAEQGWKVLASARKAEDLDHIASRGWTPIALDLADDGSVEKASSQVMELCGGTLDVLVNNAGYGCPGALEDLSRDQMRQQFEVNVFGMQHLTNRLLPALKAAAEGRIINISSVVGVVALPFFGIYSASKFAMEAISDALRVELGNTSVQVILVEPGPIDSAFRERSTGLAKEQLDGSDSRFRGVYEEEILRRNEKKNSEDRFMLPPSAAAEVILEAATARKPRTRYRVTWPAKIAPFLKTILPTRSIDRILLNRWSRRQGGSSDS